MNSVVLADRTWNRIKGWSVLPNPDLLLSTIVEESRREEDIPRFVITNAHRRIRERMNLLSRIQKAMEKPRDQRDLDFMIEDHAYWVEAGFEEQQL